MQTRKSTPKKRNVRKTTGESALDGAACSPSISREKFEHETWKYANEKYPNSCPSLLFDAGKLGICLLEWSGSCGGRWRNAWYDRIISLENAKSAGTDASEKTL
jgi:hypothetical protein